MLLIKDKLTSRGAKLLNLYQVDFALVQSLYMHVVVKNLYLHYHTVKFLLCTQSDT